MKRLYKLLFIEYLYSFLLILSIFIVTVFIFDLFEHLDELMNIYHGEKLLFVIYRLPFLMSYISMFSITIASLLALNNLSQSYQIIALFSSRISLSRLLSIILLFSFIFSALSLLNEFFLAPLAGRQSLALINKIKKQEELSISNMALKDGNSFIFVEQMERNEQLKNFIKIKLNPSGQIEEILFSKKAKKVRDLWFTEGGLKYHNDGSILPADEKISLPLNQAFLTLNYKPHLITLKESITIIKLGKIYNINIHKYQHQLSKKLLHLILPMFFILIFFRESIESRDENSRLRLFLKLIFTLTLVYVFEANVFSYAIGAQKGFFFPIIIMVAFLSFFYILKNRKKFSTL